MGNKKLRVHEVAREIGIASKELLEYFKKTNPEIKSNLSVVPDEVAEEVREQYSSTGGLKASKARKKPKPKVEFKVRRKRKKVPEPEVAAEGISAEPEKAAVKDAVPPVEEKEAPAPIPETPQEAVVEAPPVKAPKVQPPKEEPAAKAPAEPEKEKQKLKKKEKKKGKKEEVKKEKQNRARAGVEKAKGKKGKISLKTEKVDRGALKKPKKISASQMLELQVRRTPKKLRVKPKKKTRAEKSKAREKVIQEQPVVEETGSLIRWDETTTVKEVAEQLHLPVNNLIMKFMEMGSMVTVNQPVDLEAVSLVAAEYDYEVKAVSLESDDALIEEVEDNPENLVSRPPVVTIMGHVDHGKTSLLDEIRKSNIVGDEAGGITQHIGAYTVKLKDRQITFLDTPGHEAFTSMRARGAKVTDIVILVVAADDGVMPQTVEAIHHAEAARVPIVVAVNKIDKANANPDRVKQQLAEHKLVPEEWGGQTIFVEVSAKKKIGLDSLLEMVLLQADMMELKADPQHLARGVIIEARLDKTRGPLATVLVESGTIKVGDPFVTGGFAGKVRAMLNDRGKKITSAGPSVPVEILGISGVPMAGETFVAVEEERKARQIAMVRSTRMREAALSKGHRLTLDDLFQQIQQGAVKELPIIIKGDVQGSVEALSDTLERLSTSAVELKVIHGSVGGINETDVNLATASNAVIIGFNVRPEPKAASLADAEHVDIRLYNVIYDAADDVRKAMEGLLEPILKERQLGRAEVREVFSISRIGNVAGCYVLDGTLERSAHIRLIRDNVVIFEGKASSLKRFKDDVKEVATGYECGVTIENYNDIKPKDIIEFYTFDKVAAKL
ncbi:MAG: translation initiation factor IF-2 [Deltaproteobacteria bacterium]|nr:translation initiation factor IF-2 [Deltaproteobacteria bacterium]